MDMVFAHERLFTRACSTLSSLHLTTFNPLNIPIIIYYLIFIFLWFSHNTPYVFIVQGFNKFDQHKCMDQKPENIDS